MPRYIDADMLREKMYHEAFEKDSEDQRWDSGCWIRYRMFENAVDSIPTADVVEIEYAYNEEERYSSLFTCSRCKWSCSDTLCGDTATYNYCPNCGRKIRRKKDDSV